jgi:hypothetical protein
MMGLEIQAPADVFKGDLVKPGNWIVGNVEGSMFWPVNVQKIQFGGAEIVVLPVVKGLYPGLAINVPAGMSNEAAEATMMRCLSSLTWIEGHGASIRYFTGGNIPRPMGRRDEFGLVLREDFDVSYLPDPKDDRARLALALNREGHALNNPAYAFLSFYRVLEVAIPDGKKRGEWMDASIANITKGPAKEVIADLTAKKLDIGKHLRESGRHAVAHAAADPIINPDNPSDLRRLGSELPLMMALAELAIESELGVETRSTVYRRHLYELLGFKEIIGQDVVDKLLAGDELEVKANMPPLTVRLRKSEEFKPFVKMKVEKVERDKKDVVLTVKSLSGLSTLMFRLAFAEERLHFDIGEGFEMRDDDSVESAEAVAEALRFYRDYWANGQLEIYNGDTGERISRKDAFLPENVMPDIEAMTARVEEWKGIAEKRRKAKLA